MAPANARRSNAARICERRRPSLSRCGPLSAEAIILLTGTYCQVADVLDWEKAYESGRRIWKERRSPSRLASDKGRGGTIYIPKTISQRTGAPLLRYLAVVDAELLVEKLGGGQLESGKPCQIGPSHDDAIAQNVRDGWPLQHVAVLFELNERTVRKICDERGVFSKDLRREVKALKAERR